MIEEYKRQQVNTPRFKPELLKSSKKSLPYAVTTKGFALNHQPWVRHCTQYPGPHFQHLWCYLLLYDKRQKDTISLFHVLGKMTKMSPNWVHLFRWGTRFMRVHILWDNWRFQFILNRDIYFSAYPECTGKYYCCIFMYLHLENWYYNNDWPHSMLKNNNLKHNNSSQLVYKD